MSIEQHSSDRDAKFAARIAVRFAFRVDNFTHLRRAFGAQAARDALEWLRATLADHFDGGALVLRSDGDVVQVLIPDVDVIGNGLPEATCEPWMLSFCEVTAGAAVPTSEGPVHLVLSATWARDADFQETAGDWFLGESFRPAFAGDVAGTGKAWADQYRQAMTHVAAMMLAIDASLAPDGGRANQNWRADGFTLHWQPVCSLLGYGDILYHETLLRQIRDDASAKAPGAMIDAAERLGFARILDHFVLREVIAELKANPAPMLGVNISARSAADDGFWDHILEMLRRDRRAASRLVIEITESAAIPNMSSATRFVDKLKALGVVIAMDDFGTGYASIREVLALQPQIIKIDQGFLHRANSSEQGREMFEQMVRLATKMATSVVIEGVETREQSELAMAAGANWAQGYFWGGPRMRRTWRDRTPQADRPQGKILPLIRRTAETWQRTHAAKSSAGAS